MNGNLNQENQNQTPSPKKKIDINKYEDISADEVSMQKLGFGLWWLKNRKKLKNALIIFLTLISIVSWSYVLYNFGYYIFKGMNDYEKMIKELIETKTISNADLINIGAKSLTVSSLNTIASNDKNDFYVNVINSNKNYWASFDYCFVDGFSDLECGASFIFPNEKKIILTLAKKIDHSSANIKFIINHTTWKRIDNKQIPDWKKYKEERINFKTEDLKFYSAKTSELSEKLNLNTLDFSITNETAYSYWEAPLIITLFKNNKITGIDRYILKDFNSNDKKTIKITWPGNTDASEIEIVPDINILDKTIYITP